MKFIQNILATLIVLIFTFSAHGQDNFNIKKINDNINNQNYKVWIYVGITHIIWETGYFAGGKFQADKHNVFGIESYEFGELKQGGIIFQDQIPNRVVQSFTTNLNYGYCINFESNFFKLIPTLGIGYTTGTWRTDEELNTGGAGGWFNFSTKSYHEIPFSGISVSPQIDLIFHTSWGGIGLMLTHNTTFFVGNNYSSNDFSFHICMGKMR